MVRRNQRLTDRADKHAGSHRPGSRGIDGCTLRARTTTVTHTATSTAAATATIHRVRFSSLTAPPRGLIALSNQCGGAVTILHAICAVRVAVVALRCWECHRCGRQHLAITQADHAAGPSRRTAYLTLSLPSRSTAAPLTCLYASVAGVS